MKNETIEFFVPGKPGTAGSKNPFPIYRKGADGQKIFTGKVVAVDANKKKSTWMADVKHFAYQAYQGEPLTGPVSLEIIFVMPRPKNHFKSNGELKPNAEIFHGKRPDLTKMLRALEDALTGIIWQDDSCVAATNMQKIYGPNPGAQVKIMSLNHK